VFVIQTNYKVWQIKMKKINYLAIIPARKDSKRIKNKNLVKINKKELIKFTIEAAKKTKKINKIIVTSDDKKILKISKKLKTDIVKRPKNLSGDSSATELAIFQALNHFYKDNLNSVKNIILLQPTSPLRNAKDIAQCINLFERKKYDSIFSAFKKKDFIWKINKNNIQSLSYNFKKRKKTQIMKELIFENGAIYIFKVKKFLRYKNRLFGKIGIYYMDKNKSIDIDDMNDVKLVEKIFRI